LALGDGAAASLVDGLKRVLEIVDLDDDIAGRERFLPLHHAPR